MPAPFPPPKIGKELSNELTGFPLFFNKRKPRVITADPWAYLEHLTSKGLTASEQKQSLAFIEQAYDFYSAALNSQAGSQPLLYYYSFINLIKAAFLIDKNPLPDEKLRHGIDDPKTNIKQRFSIKNQIVHFKGRAKNNTELFPEFLILMKGSIPKNKNMKLIDIMRQIPSIHRTFTQVTQSPASFMPLQKITLLKDNHKYFCRIILSKNDHDAKSLFKKHKSERFITQSLRQVNSPIEDEIWLETKEIAAKGRGVDSKLLSLAQSICTPHLSAILTNRGYRYYFNCISNDLVLPTLPASLAAIFYFSSITRYKPYDFDKIRSSNHGWLCDELLETQPSQFIYTLCSILSGVDVVKPYSIL